MGSKNKIIDRIGAILLSCNFDSFYDAFAGSNVVAYYLKCAGKKVITNDFMVISHMAAKAIIENATVRLYDEDVDMLIRSTNNQSFIAEKFKGLYFGDEENSFLDRVRYNIELLDNKYKKAIALASIVRACMKKRPRGIFTFIGHRYDDGRLDIKKSLEDHFIESVKIFNDAVFDNGKECCSYNQRTEALPVEADLVYLDPPYFTLNSDNDYVRRYHFVEGLVKNWEGLDIQEHTLTKKFKSYQSPFASRLQAYEVFESLIERFKDSIISISYSSNCLPTKDELLKMLKKYKRKVVVHEIDHLYSFGNQNHKIGNNFNRVKEFLFVGS